MRCGFQIYIWNRDYFITNVYTITTRIPFLTPAAISFCHIKSTRIHSHAHIKYRFVEIAVLIYYYNYRWRIISEAQTTTHYHHHHLISNNILAWDGKVWDCECWFSSTFACLAGFHHYKHSLSHFGDTLIRYSRHSILKFIRVLTIKLFSHKMEMVLDSYAFATQQIESFLWAMKRRKKNTKRG